MVSSIAVVLVSVILGTFMLLEAVVVFFVVVPMVPMGMVVSLFVEDRGAGNLITWEILFFLGVIHGVGVKIVVP